MAYNALKFINLFLHAIIPVGHLQHPKALFAMYGRLQALARGVAEVRDVPSLKGSPLLTPH